MTNSYLPYTLPAPDLLWKILTDEKTSPLTLPHPTLLLPFRLDGHLYAPKELQRFDQTLFFYLNDMLMEAGQLRAFASKSALRRYLMDTEQLPGDFERPSKVELPDPFSFPGHSAPASAAYTGRAQFPIHSLTHHNRSLICFSQPCFKGHLLVIARHTHLSTLSAFWPETIESVLEI